VQSLKQLGIAVTIRLVDPTEFERRRKSYDYDIVTVRYSQRLTPGIELRNRYGSVGAAENGTDNFAGVANPAVDAMIEAAIAARSRADLATAVRALDRVLRAGHYWVPAWYKAVHNLAYWDKFERPKTAPRFQRGVIDTWWAKR
jgi:microcin C transport system substrate-binding protein